MPHIAYFQAWLHLHLRHQRGASLVEYCLLVGLIALVCFAALQALGPQVAKPYSSMGNSLS
jgi:pilus assembly protein Flp/PilA